MSRTHNLLPPTSGFQTILQSISASASSSINLAFSGSNYDEVEIRAINVITSTNCDLILRMGTGAGPTYDTAGANYASSFEWKYGTGTTGSLTTGSAKNITEFRFGTINTVSDIGPTYQFNARCILTGMASGTPTTMGRGRSSWFGSAGPSNMIFFGLYSPTTEITGAQIVPSTGTITSGKFVVIGRSY